MNCRKLSYKKVNEGRPILSRQKYFRNPNNKECYNLFTRKNIFTKCIKRAKNYISNSENFNNIILSKNIVVELHLLV